MRCLIGTKRHINNAQGALTKLRYTPSVRHHHFKGHAKRIGHAIEHHAKGVANQHNIRMLIGQLRNRRGIGGERKKRFGTIFSRADILHS